MLFTVFSLLELFFSCCIVGERKPTWNAGHCFARKFSAYPNVATSEARIWLAICEFLWLLTNQNVWFVTSLHWINPENCIYLNQSELSNFFMYIIRNSNEPRSWSWGKIEELKNSPIIKLYGSKKVVNKNKFSLSLSLSPSLSLSLPLSLPLSPTLSLPPPLSPSLSPPLSPLSLPPLSLPSLPPSLSPFSLPLSLSLSLPPLSPPSLSPLFPLLSLPLLSPPLSLPLSLKVK